MLEAKTLEPSHKELMSVCNVIWEKTLTFD